MKRTDTYSLEIVINTASHECEVHLDKEMSLAELQDMIASVTETYPQATSFMFVVVVHKHLEEEIVQ